MLRRPWRSILGILVVGSALTSCTTLPEPKFDKATFPENAFVDDVTRPYTKLGPVRSKVDFNMLDPGREEAELCRNYYNRAVRDLLKFAREKGADAVIGVRSVVMLENGKYENYKTPECSDEGQEGQILTQGIAVKWKREADQSPTRAGRPKVDVQNPSQADLVSPVPQSSPTPVYKNTPAHINRPDGASHVLHGPISPMSPVSPE